MKTIEKVFNSFWIGAAAFGLAGTVLWIMGHQLFAGACFGAAVVKFISSLKNR
jgi:hypothetical protein